MKHRLSGFAFACAITATGAVWAQGYTVMGSGDAPAQQPPPPPPGAQLVVQPAPSGQGPSNGGQTTVLSRTVTPRRPEEYGGVTPGMPAVPPGFRRRPRAGTLVAWPGFQMVPGGSRVFVVLTTPVPPGDGGRNGRVRRTPSIRVVPKAPTFRVSVLLRCDCSVGLRVAEGKCDGAPTDDPINGNVDPPLPHTPQTTVLCGGPNCRSMPPSLAVRHAPRGTSAAGKPLMRI